MRIKVDIKIKFNQIIRDAIEKQIQNTIYNNKKTEDQVWYNLQITRYFYFFITSKKYFLSNSPYHHQPN